MVLPLLFPLVPFRQSPATDALLLVWPHHLPTRITDTHRVRVRLSLYLSHPLLIPLSLSHPSPSLPLSLSPLHSLDNNNIGASGAAAIGEALQHNKTLTELT